jgi:hypothetical protein
VAELSTELLTALRQSEIRDEHLDQIERVLGRP